MCIQKNGIIHLSLFGHHKNVMLICVSISRHQSVITFGNVKSYIYGNKDQLKLRKIRLKNLNLEEFMKLQERNKEYDRVRDATEDRKLMHQAVDKKRNQTSPRKLRQKTVDKERDANPSRKLMHQIVDKEQDKTPVLKTENEGVTQRFSLLSMGALLIPTES